MTNEEKLFTLLQIAIENGCQNNFIEHFLKYPMIIGKNGQKQGVLFINTPNNNIEVYSINDLVINFKKGEMSFIESLCLATIKDEKFEHTSESNLDVKKTAKRLEKEWSWDYELDDRRYTSERFEWLFKTFNHLLHD